jgi:glutaconate CoA-transferase subunit A
VITALPVNDTHFLADADAIASAIPDNAFIAMPADNSIPAMEVVRALIRRRAKGLRLLGVPALGIGADQLIGAGCVAEIETSAVSLGEAGLAPRFTEAAENNSIRVRDATCPMIHTALQAAEKGVPFMPLRGVLGSALIDHRPDWRVIDNPLATVSDPILLAPAIIPDFSLFHARWADRTGNVWVGRHRELITMAHAAKRSFVTVENIRDDDMLDDELLAPGVLPAVYVSGVAIASRGAWPLAVADEYDVDDPHIADYARSARTQPGFQEYLERYVLTRSATGS